jgi:hypothetical protein
MSQYFLPAGMEVDVSSDDDDSVVAGVVANLSAAKVGDGKAEVLQHAKKSWNVRSAVANAKAI